MTVVIRPETYRLDPGQREAARELLELAMPTILAEARERVAQEFAPEVFDDLGLAHEILRGSGGPLASTVPRRRSRSTTRACATCCAGSPSARSPTATTISSTSASESSLRSAGASSATSSEGARPSAARCRCSPRT